MNEPGYLLQPQDTGSVHDEPGGGDLHPHPVPLWMLAGVFGALIVLTVLTVAVTYVDLGRWYIYVALIIATVKAGLVAEIFMHLRWDKPFHRVAFLGAVAFVALFIGISMLDTDSYAGDIIPGYAPEITQ